MALEGKCATYDVLRVGDGRGGVGRRDGGHFRRQSHGSAGSVRVNGRIAYVRNLESGRRWWRRRLLELLVLLRMLLLMLLLLLLLLKMDVVRLNDRIRSSGYQGCSGGAAAAAAAAAAHATAAAAAVASGMRIRSASRVIRTDLLAESSSPVTEPHLDET